MTPTTWSSSGPVSPVLLRPASWPTVAACSSPTVDRSGLDRPPRATPLAVLERLEVLAAVEQVHHRIVIAVGGRDFVLATAFAFATFDYRTFCDLLVPSIDRD